MSPLLERFFIYCMNGIGTGSLYVLVALGIVLIYRTTRVLNFSHGDMGVTTAFVAYFLYENHFPLPLAFVTALLLGGILSCGIYRGIIVPAERRGSGPMGLTLITLAFSLILQGLNGILFGTEPKPFPFFFPPGKTFVVGGFSFSFLSLLSFIVGGVLSLLFYLLVSRTPAGVAMRALSENPELATLAGVSRKNILTFVWFFSAFFAGVSGILLAPVLFLDPYFMLEPFLKGFASAVLGGLNSFLGAFAGGILLGVGESLFVGFVSVKYKLAFVFVWILLVLLVRSEGIFGEKEVERV